MQLSIYIFQLLQLYFCEFNFINCGNSLLKFSQSENKLGQWKYFVYQTILLVQKTF